MRIFNEGRGSFPGRAGGRQAGMALLMVLLALSFLLALTLPFLISVTAEGAAARRRLSLAKAKAVSASLRDSLLRRASASDPTLDAVPDEELGPLVDTVEENALFQPGAAEEADLLARTGEVPGGETWDAQSRICAEGAGPLVYADVLEWSAMITEPVDSEAAEIPVDSTEGFDDTGYLWILGELVRYGSKNAHAFLQCTRAVGYDQSAGITGRWGPARKYRVGTPVLDVRAWLLATGPVTRSGRRAWRPWRRFEEMKEIAAEGFGPLPPDKLARLKTFMVLRSSRRFSPAWVNPQALLQAVAQEGRRPVLFVPSSRYFNTGSLIRIDGAGGKVEYGVVLGSGRAGGGRVQVLSSSGTLVLEEGLLQDWQEYEGVVRVLAPVPVNLNTAPEEVLAVLFTRLRNRRHLQSLRRAGGAAAMQGAARDWISPSEARELARILVSLRRPGGGYTGPGDGTGPFTGPKDLVDRVFRKLLGQGGLLSLDPLLMAALYKNALNSLDRGVTFGTLPFCFWSAPVVGYRAGVSILSPAGGEWARWERRGLAFVRPEGLPLQAVWTTQADFDEALRISRGARGWITFPNNTSFFDGRNDPPSRFLAHTWPYMAVRSAMDRTFDAAAYYPSTKAESSRARPEPARLQYPGRSRSLVRFFDKEPDPEGRDVGKRPFLWDIFGGGKGRNRSAGTGSLAGPFHASFWFKPSRGGNMTLMDIGGGKPGMDRVHLFLNGSELVLEVLDRAGLDPEPGVYGPRRTAGAIRMPLSEYPIRPGEWTHFMVQVLGNSPDRMTLFVDGVPRGRHDYMTRLVSHIPPFDHQSVKDRYIQIQVEDARGFPSQGVLRIGSELFEYTSLKGNTFSCERVDSTGGRDARHSAWEWGPQASRKGPGSSKLPVPAPEHQPGETVVLYGYSVPLQDYAAVPPVELRLPSEIGPWRIARMITRKDEISVGRRSLGRGIREDYRGDLELGPPEAGAAKGKSSDKTFMGGFQKEGGYALLVQRMLVVQGPPGGGGGGGGQGQTETKVIGGVVVVHYSSVRGNKLTGVRFGGFLPDLKAGSLDLGSRRLVRGAPGLPTFFDGKMRAFVAEWATKQMEARPSNWAYVIPVSLKLSGQVALLPNPADTGCSEYVQILPARVQADTEWVRYDAILRDTLIRDRPAAVKRLLSRLGSLNVTLAQTTSWPPPFLRDPNFKDIKSGRNDEIGHVDPKILPIDYWCGRAFRFRGPPETGTSTHPQTPDALVLPVFRLRDRWGPTAAFYGRPGRKDRVALVEGTETAAVVGASAGPLVEWHTINWTTRIYGYDKDDPAVPSPGRPSILAAFMEGVRGVFSQGGSRGRASRSRRAGKSNSNPYDIRRLTRIVKFPSGEMPWKFTSKLQFGMPQCADGWPADGLIDMVTAGIPAGTSNNLGGLLMLAFPTAQTGAGRITLHARIVFPGTMAGLSGRLGGVLFRSGGLLQVGEEILAYREVTGNGEVQLAANGRGLLGTKATAHGMWETVTPLTRPGATVLSMDVDAGSPLLPVARADRLPLDRGLVLVDKELVHYVYSRRSLSLEMPPRRAGRDRSSGNGAGADERFRPGDGIFRGRFGTVPAAHPAGTAVIEFPFRYWDTYAERADAPEMHHLDLHLESPRAVFETVTWEEETPLALVDLQLLARVDARAPWWEKPSPSKGLFLFDAPTRKNEARRIGMQGNVLDLRFFTVYKPGAFDPVNFLARAWKTAPTLKSVKVVYEAPTLVLEEEGTR